MYGMLLSENLHQTSSLVKGQGVNPYGQTSHKMYRIQIIQIDIQISQK